MTTTDPRGLGRGGHRSALRHERRRRLPQRHARRCARRRQRPAAREPSWRSALKPPALRRPAADLRRPGLRLARSDRRPDLRTTTRTPPSASPPADVDPTIEPASRRDDRPRQTPSACPTSTGRCAPTRCSAPATRAPQDRRVPTDILRNTGRADLSSFLGGSTSNRSMEPPSGRSRPTPKPTSNGRSTRHRSSTARTASRAPSTTSDEYVAGINAFIAAANVQPAVEAGGVRHSRPGRSKLEADRRDRDRLADRWNLRPAAAATS